MANRLFQFENYIIAQRDDGGTLTTYEFVKKSAIYLERNEYYDISASGGTAFSIGKAEIGTFLDAEAGGVFYTEATLLTFLRTYSGILPDGGGGGITYVATDATLDGDGTPDFPLSVVQSAGLSTKSGRKLLIDFAGNPKTAAVIFAAPFVDNLYSAVLTCETINGASYVPNVLTLTPNGFIIDMSVNFINNLVAVHWIAIKNGETT